MLSELWNSLLIHPLLNALVALYHQVGNFGVAIILFTIILKIALLPVLIPSMRTMRKQRDLQPELDKIRKKFKNDKKKQAEAQMELFKKHGLNPAAGCLSQIPMFLVLAAMIGVVRNVALAENVLDLNQYLYFDAIKFTVEHLQTNFLYLDLAQRDPYLVLPVLTGIAQFLVSKYSMSFTKKAEKIAKKTADKSDDVAYNMQEQMLYVMPVITVFFGMALPSGVVLYMFVSTLLQFVQTYYLVFKPTQKVKA